jgi:DNA-binding winged helix-turn-helix (wHTH) protein
MVSWSEGSAIVEFGRFRFAPHRRELFADGRSIEIGGRAFDVLMALVEARGAVVGKDALMRRVWPDRVVEENNLQAHISALRAAFGADRGLIRTVSGRGYQFTGEIRVLSASADGRAGAGLAGAESNSTLPPTNLPEPVSEVIGRDTEVEEVSDLVGAHRLVTLTGLGGIGKTRLALAVARRLLPEFADGVWLAEFSPLSDPGLAPVTVAAAVGLELGGGEVSARRVAEALAGRPLFLVLHTCEHVIAAAAALAEAVLRAGGAHHRHQPRAAPRGGGADLLGAPARRARRGGRQPLAIRRGSAIPGEGAGGGAALRAGPAPGDNRGDLPAARRHAAGDRAGGGARRGTRHRGA